MRRQKVLVALAPRPNVALDAGLRQKGIQLGISSKTAQWLFEYAKQKPFSGSVLELGVQGTSFSYDRLSEVAKNAGVTSAALDRALRENSGTSRVDDRPLFKAMGFSEVIRTDYDTFEGAEFAFDLNADGVPTEWRNRFDCIMDGGTIEHVFHTQNVLKNIFEFLKVGGRIVHMSPTNNFVDHGFYSFSPTFFVDYYAANGFEIDRCTLVEFTRDVEGAPWIFGDYSPGDLDFVQFGGLGGKVYATFFIATKTATSTFGKVPQQNLYKRVWAEGNQNSQFARSAERYRMLDEARGRPLWLQSRFDKMSSLTDRLTHWLRRPSQRRDFPLDNRKSY